MPIAVTCPCGRTLQAPERLAGREARCPACQKTVRVPSLQSAVSDPAPVGRTGFAIGLILVVAVIGLVFLGGGGLAAYYFFLKKPDDRQPRTASRPSSASTQEPPASSSGDWFGADIPDGGWQQHLKYLPDEPAMLSHYHLLQLRGIPLYEELTKDKQGTANMLRELSAEFGIPEQEMMTLTIAGGSVNDRVLIFSIGANLDMAANLARRGPPAHKVGDINVYEDEAKKNLLAVPEQGIGLKGSAALIDDILKRQSPAKLNRLKPLKAIADFKHTDWSMVDRSFLAEKDVPAFMKNALGLTANHALTSDYAFTITLRYADEDTAKANQEAAKTDFGKQYADATCDVSVSGPKLVIEVKLTAEQAKKDRDRVLEGVVPR